MSLVEMCFQKCTCESKNVTCDPIKKLFRKVGVTVQGMCPVFVSFGCITFECIGSSFSAKSINSFILLFRLKNSVDVV